MWPPAKTSIAFRVAILSCVDLLRIFGCSVLFIYVANSGAGTNLKVGRWGTGPARKLGEHRCGEKRRKKFLVMPLHFLALKVQLVVLVSAFVMVSTVWSVSCLLFFFSRCPCAQPFVVGGGGGYVPQCPMESAPLVASTQAICREDRHAIMTKTESVGHSQN